MKIDCECVFWKESYLQYEDDIFQLVEKYGNYLDFNLKLKIFVREKDKNEFDGTEASLYKKGRWYNLDLYDIVFENNLKYLDGIFFHEFAHIYDHHHVTLNNKNICKADNSSFTSKNDYITYIGYHFWTEFFAYYKSYDAGFYDSKDQKSFLDLLKIYKNIKDNHKIIISEVIKEDAREDLDDCFTLFVDSIKYLIYELSKYIASLPFRKNNYKYCEKTTNKKEFKELSIIVDKLTDLVIKMTHGTYGKYMTKRLYNIGFYLYSKLFYSNNIDFERKGRKIATVFFLEDDM